MEQYRAQVNSLSFYLIVAAVLLFIAIMCVVFIVKSYKAGVAMGMDKKLLNKAITSSATFTLIPSISILLGVIALSGTLGVPISWLRLSVVGALQYELNVAEIAATATGLTGLKITEMTIEAFVTIAMVMTAGILGGVLCSLFGLKAYLGKIQKKPKAQEETGEKKKPGFGAYATVAMFIGLCSAYIGSYVGEFVANGNGLPLFVALVSAVVMAVFEFLIQKKNVQALENFSVAASMLCGMIAAVLVNL